VITLRDRSADLEDSIRSSLSRERQPTRFAGPTNIATAMINFPSLAAYEQYRERLGKDPDSIENLRRAEETGCMLVEDRTFMEQV